MTKNGATHKTKKPKNERAWSALTVMRDVEADLDQIRQELEKTLGIKLSWSKFFAITIKDLRDVVRARSSEKAAVAP